MQNLAGTHDKSTLVVPMATAVLLSGAVLMTSSTTANSQTMVVATPDLGLVSYVHSQSLEEVNGVARERSLQHAVNREIKAEMAQKKAEAAAKEAKQQADELVKQAELKKLAAKWQSAKVPRPVQVSRGAQPQVASTQTQITVLLDYAKSLKGVPYLYGGTNPQVGLDCSALTLLAFHKIGISLPRTASQQFRMGVGIPRSSLQPGDLVFFSTNGPGASHVGIYLGAGDFISTTNKGVMIQKLASAYWNKYYRGARRVINPEQS